MKVKFRGYSKKEKEDLNFVGCDKCVKASESVSTHRCCMRNDCAGGYYVKRTRPRKSRDRRLLEALLKCLGIFHDCEQITCLCEKATGVTIFGLNDSDQKQLVAIKQAMERKGGAK